MKMIYDMTQFYNHNGLMLGNINIERMQKFIIIKSIYAQRNVQELYID